jgi:hypothetical protein
MAKEDSEAKEEILPVEESASVEERANEAADMFLSGSPERGAFGGLNTLIQQFENKEEEEPADEIEVDGGVQGLDEEPEHLKEASIHESEDDVGQPLL